MVYDRLLVIGVRHGRTDANSKGTLRAWDDYPLSRLGEMDADLAADKAGRYDPKVIYHDDLTRTIQTANRISCKLHNVPTEVDYSLRTADMGEWTGMPDDEVQDVLLHWYQHPWQDAPSGESYGDFMGRFYPCFDNKLDLSRRVNGFNPIVAVMHGRNFAALHSRYNFIAPEKAEMPLPGGVALFTDGIDGINMKFLTPTEPVLIDH